MYKICTNQIWNIPFLISMILILRKPYKIFLEFLQLFMFFCHLPSAICHINYPNLFPVVVQMADKHLNNSLITFSHCCEVV